MHTEQLKEILGNIPLFDGCSSGTLTNMAKIAKEFDCEKGQVIYETGDDAVDAYVLVDGIVTFINKSGVEFLNIQRLVQRSTVFGWVALVPEHPKRLGSAQCLEDSKILSINGDALLGILKQDTKSGYQVMKRLCSLIAGTFVDKP